jgi:hypothetical protein
MIQNLMLFLAPEPLPQATPKSPPAVAAPAEPLHRDRRNALRFGVRVLGNAIGFGILFAACWFSIRVMEAAVTTAGAL